MPHVRSPIRRATPFFVAWLVVLGACAQPALYGIGGPWYVDDLTDGKPVDLYFQLGGSRVLIDREVVAYNAMKSCLTYASSRLPNVVFAVIGNRIPLAVGKSDPLRPWRMDPDGLRRFDPVRTDDQGRIVLDVEWLTQDDVCMPAFRQPEFRSDWANATTFEFARVEPTRRTLEVDAADDMGNTALHKAVAERSHSIVDALLRAGADPNASNAAGVTVLMSALKVRDPAPLRRLLDAQASVNDRDRSGQTALMHAARYHLKAAVEILLANGADAAARDEHGATAADMVRDDPTLRDLLERAAAESSR